jgi:hypothetical protein
MTMLFLDSFDHYGTSDLPLKWSAVTGAVTINATGGRRGGGGMSLPLATSARKDLAGTKTLIVGFAIKVSTFTTITDPNASPWCLTLGNGDGVHLYFAIALDGSISVYRRNGSASTDWQQLGKTTGAVVDPNVYAYLEVKASISATGTGTVKVLVNGANVLNLVNVATISYLSATETITRVSVISPANGGTTSVDDLYMCDTSGLSNNDFFGDVRVDAVKPNADGTYGNFTPDSGVNHYSRVNEQVADQLSYVASSTVGAKDSYQFEDLTSIVGVVRGVQIVDVSTKDDAGVRSIGHLVKSGVSEEYSAAIPLSTDRKFYTTIHEHDPATGTNWTQAGINAAEFGIVVAA